MFLLRPSRIMAVKPRIGTFRTTSARPSFSQIQRSIPAAKLNTMSTAITTSRLNSLLLKTSCSVSKSTKASVKYQCPKCDFQAEDKNDMKNHVVVIHKSKPFVCFHCEETFSNFKVMQSHVKAWHPEVGVIKEPYALVSGIDSTKLKGSKKTTLSTKGTSPAPSDQGSLPPEINAAHSSPSLVKSAGTTSNAANDNMVNENKPKPKVKKSRKNSKEEHVLKKSEEGIQAVEWQAKNQTQKNLKLEMEVDANKSAKNSVMYQCPKCDFQAEDKNDMKNHVVVIHKSKPFVCFHCEETFSNFKVMQSHVKDLHPEMDVVKEPYALVSEMENIKLNGSSKTATLSTKGTNTAPSDQSSLPQEIESAVQSSNKARDTTLDQSELKPKGKKMKKTKSENGITDSEIEAMLKILEEGQKSDSTKSKDNKLHIAEHLNVKAIKDKNLKDEAYLLTKSQEKVLPIKQQTLKEKRKKIGKRNLEPVTDESAVLQSKTGHILFKAEKEAEERLVMQQMANAQRENEEKLLKEQKEKLRLLEEQKEKEEKLLKEQKEKEWLLEEQKEKERLLKEKERLLEEQKEKERLLEEKKAMEEKLLKEQKEKEEQKLKEQNEEQQLLKEQKEKEQLLEEQKEKEKILKEKEDKLLKERKRERLLKEQKEKEQQLLEEQKAKEEKLLKEQKEKEERKLKEQKEEQLLKELKEKEKLLKEKEEQKEKERLLEEQKEKEEKLLKEQKEKEWLLKEQKEKERLLKEQKQRLLEEQKDKERLLEEKKAMEEKLLKEQKEKEERKLKEPNEEQQLLREEKERLLQEQKEERLLKEQKEKERLFEEQKEKEKILKEKEDQLLKAQKRERLLKEQKEKEQQLLEEQKAISNKLFKEKKERELKEQKEEQLLKELKEKEKLLKEKEDQLLKEQKRERLLKEQTEKEQQLIEEQKAKEEKLLKEQNEKEEQELKEQNEEQLLKEQKEEQRLVKQKEKELSLLKEKKEKAIKTAFQQDIKKELNTDLQGNESGLLNWFKKIISRK